MRRFRKLRRLRRWRKWSARFLVEIFLQIYAFQLIMNFCVVFLRKLKRYIWGVVGSIFMRHFIHFAEKIEPMAYTYGFEKLKVWLNSIALVKTIYSCTRNFPNEEKFGITSQIRRSSLSVPTNISEGVSRKTPKDQAHFTTIAYSSLTETLNLLIIVKELSLMNEDDSAKCRRQVEEVSFLLNNLRKSQQPSTFSTSLTSSTS